ncbi:MAG: inosine/xanthosine triphosphatase [Candidatus Diapherotrites archaeon]|nr:inosine/xanthosine triphosphatase [Candidatus Diapherotrites archaeon]
MLVAIGTSNPTKIEAVRSAFRKIWPKAKFVSIEAKSGISEQPNSDEEAIKGALNRAKKAIKKANADFGVGLEGTTIETKHGMFLCGWVVIIDREGKIGLGCTSKIQLPEKIANKVRLGEELGPVMDKLSGKKDVKKKQGAVGILTKGHVTRKDAFEQALLVALSKFICSEYYN